MAVSIAATDYALAVAREVPRAAQAVLFALAARAGSRTAMTYTGAWLRDALNLTEQNVRVHIRTLEQAGIVSIERRDGSSSIVRFPIAAVVHTPNEIVGGQRQGPPTKSIRTPNEIVGGPPTKSRAVSGSLSGDVSGDDTPADDVAPAGTDVKKIMKDAAHAERVGRQVVAGIGVPGWARTG